MKACQVLLVAVTLVAPSFAQGPGPVARMIVYRDLRTSWLSGAPTIYLDEVPLVKLSAGRYFYLDVAPTSHFFKAGARGTPYTLEFKALQTYILRLDNGGFVQAPNDLGIAEVNRLFPLSPASVFDLRVKQDRPILLPPPPAPAPPVPIRNLDIIQMTRGGLSEWLIIRKIRETTATDFKVTPADLVQLKEQGVSEMVINAVLDAATAAATAAAAKK